MKSIFISCVLICSIPFEVHADGLSPEEKNISSWVVAHMGEAEQLLETVVNINSDTINHDGVRKVGAIFREEFDKIGLQTRWISMPNEMNRAGHLFAERSGKKGKRILLIGHLDTVFEKESPFQKFEKNGDIVKGPGAADMKSGDIVILYALKALQNSGALEDRRLKVALMGDEEKVGMPYTVSRQDLISAAKSSDAALAFESGVRDLRKIATARRSFTRWSLKVTGREGHSSRIFSEKAGVGAIFEAGRILNAFYDQLRNEKYLTFNPGIILGGTDVKYDSSSSQGTSFGKNNVIAQSAIVTGDLRTISEEQRETTKKKMSKIVSENLPGTSATIEFEDSYPPMSPTKGNQELLEKLSQASVDLGQGPVVAQDPAERGAADASFVAPYVNVIDGLGAAGGEEHSVKEFLDLKTLVPTIQRTAILIYRLTR